MQRSLKMLVGAIIFMIASCESPANSNADNSGKKIVVSKKNKIDPNRSSVKKDATASFSKAIEGQALQGTFAVNIYETPHTFDYLMKIRYAELYVTDTLTLPDLGTQPTPVIKDTSVPNACIVGFMDDQKKFRTYKLVQVKNNKLSIKALKHYAVATYRVQ